MPHKQRLLLTLSFCVLMLPGCQAFKSKFSSLPKLPSPKDLAFWKKDSDTLPPPPPSRHLSPASSSGDINSQFADSDSKGIDIDQYRRQIDQRMDDIQNKVEGFASKGSKRSPYSLDDSSSSESNGGFGGGSFKSNDRFASNGSFSSDAQAGQSDAQKRFSASVANLEKPSVTEERTGGFKSPREMFSTDPPAAVQGAIAKAKNDLDSGFKSTVDGSGFKSSLAKVNNSLYDMNGNLTSATKNVGKAAERTFDATRQKLNQAIGSMSDGAREVAKSSEQFAGKLKNQFSSATAKVVPSFGSGNAFKSPFSAGKSSVDAGLKKAESKVAGVNSGFNFPQNAPGLMQSQDQKNSFDRTRVANVTPVQSSVRASTSPQTPTTGFQSQPPNPKQFSNSLAQSNGGGTGFKATSPEKKPLFGNAQPIPSAFGSGENKPVSHVGDVDVPAKLLKGSGIYAPGSVHLVR